MVASVIERDFRKKVCEKVHLVSAGMDRFRVLTPFMFQDGDHLVILLKQEQGQWVLSDEGHTFMHLTYDLEEKDLQRGNRAKIVIDALAAFSVRDRDGELAITIRDDRYGDALFSFVQALLKVSDMTFLSREQVRSTFMEDFRTFVEEKVPEARRAFDWHDESHDPEGKYPVDCRINGLPRPLFVYALPNDDKVRDATICLHQFERWGVSFRSLGIHQDLEEINVKVAARFTDICEKQFSSLMANKDRIARFLQESLRQT
jgi:hypothetical protein